MAFLLVRLNSLCLTVSDNPIVPEPQDVSMEKKSLPAQEEPVEKPKRKKPRRKKAKRAEGSTVRVSLLRRLNVTLAERIGERSSKEEPVVRPLSMGLKGLERDNP